WEGLKSLLRTFWEGLKSLLRTFWEGLKSLLRTFILLLLDGGKPFGNALGDRRS
ncbi:MAG: hypothetical protein EAZ73_24630, partial [Oscillatoriales cyanobacterium]